MMLAFISVILIQLDMSSISCLLTIFFLFIKVIVAFIEIKVIAADIQCSRKKNHFCFVLKLCLKDLVM